jgi:hypothetical protein
MNSYLAGLLTLPALLLLYCVVVHALGVTKEVRFKLGAHWQYCRDLPFRRRPWLFLWPFHTLRTWLRLFVLGYHETVGLTFKNGPSFRRGAYGKAVRETNGRPVPQQ